MADKVEIVKVQSGLKDNKVALYERDKAHPNGEAFVANRFNADGDLEKPEVEVAKTPEVVKRLRDGRLVEVKSGFFSSTSTDTEQIDVKKGRPKNG